MHKGATTIRSSCEVTILVPEFVRLRGPPTAPQTAKLQGFHGVARPGLEPGTPRFSAAGPPQAACFQPEREAPSPACVPALSRAFRAIAEYSGAGSPTCA